MLEYMHPLCLHMSCIKQVYDVNVMMTGLCVRTRQPVCWPILYSAMHPEGQTVCYALFGNLSSMG
jgi:hypothetical protein